MQLIPKSKLIKFLRGKKFTNRNQFKRTTNIVQVTFYIKILKNKNSILENKIQKKIHIFLINQRFKINKQTTLFFKKNKIRLVILFILDKQKLQTLTERQQKFLMSHPVRIANLEILLKVMIIDFAVLVKFNQWAMNKNIF